MEGIDKKELAECISKMIAVHDKAIKLLQEKKEAVVDPYVSTSDLFYNKGMKRGLLNLAEKYELDLEF